MSATRSGRDLDIEITALSDLDLFGLRDRWRQLYGSLPHVRTSRELMMRAIAYRLQEDELGGLPSSTKARLTKWRADSEPLDRRSHRIKPGTRFLREWQGSVHEVTMLDDGTYWHRDKRWRSLSAIAREITGTRWSGPAFFGLSRPKELGKT